jgi:hypothetical protein
VSALVPRREFTLLAELERVGAVTAVALDLTQANLSFDRYEAFGRWLGTVGSASKWWIGDWLVFGERLYGEEAAQASEALRLSEDGRQDCLRVALAFPWERRRELLTWWHHRVVAVRWLTVEQREDLLDRAEREGLSTRELWEAREEFRAGSRGAPTEPPVVVEAVVEAARMLVRSARLDDGHDIFVVPGEAVRRLRALLGEEDAA